MASSIKAMQKTIATLRRQKQALKGSVRSLSNRLKAAQATPEPDVQKIIDYAQKAVAVAVNRALTKSMPGSNSSAA